MWKMFCKMETTIFRSDSSHHTKWQDGFDDAQNRNLKRYGSLSMIQYGNNNEKNSCKFAVASESNLLVYLFADKL